MGPGERRDKTQSVEEKRLFRRDISLEVEEAGASLLLIRGRLTDVRTGDPGEEVGPDRASTSPMSEKEKGHTVHDLEVTARVEVGSGLIRSIEGAMHRVPYPQCREALRCLRALEGKRIAPGFSSLVREVVWSRDGCVHLAVLVTEIGHVSVQGMGAWTSRRLDWRRLPKDQLLRGLEALQLPDSCFTWRRDGELMRGILEGKEGPGEDVS